MAASSVISTQYQTLLSSKDSGKVLRVPYLAGVLLDSTQTDIDIRTVCRFQTLKMAIEERRMTEINERRQCKNIERGKKRYNIFGKRFTPLVNVDKKTAADSSGQLSRAEGKGDVQRLHDFLYIFFRKPSLDGLKQVEK